MPAFNLLDKPWIPCLGNDGKPRRLGIKEALTQAGSIRQIAASNPMDRVAILRFLLALLYWCKGNPPARADAALGDSFPAEWFAKLDEHEDYFNLLGEGRRFYQYRKDGDPLLTANYLIHEVPTGTNFWHFRHSTDKVNGLCLVCCAMGLLRLPVFSTSGGSGKPPGINAKPPIYVIPVGNSLAETLWLSWRPVKDLGMPAWEQPDLQLPKKGDVSILTGLTWLPRRVWLESPSESKATCIGCGREDHLILSTVFAPIGSTKTEGDDSGRRWCDPHVIYESKGKGTPTSLHARNALGASDAAAGQWAALLAGILQEGATITSPPSVSGRTDTNSKARVWLVGFSTVQSNKYLEAFEAEFPLTDSPHQSEAIVELFKRWQGQSWGLARKAHPQDAIGASRKHPEIQATIDAVRPHVEGKVSAKAGELLSGGDTAWQEAASEYRPMMEVVARSLSPGFTTAAVERRKQIAGALPDMTTTGPAKKATRRKGGAP